MTEIWDIEGVPKRCPPKEDQHKKKDLQIIKFSESSYTIKDHVMQKCAAICQIREKTSNEIIARNGRVLKFYLFIAWFYLFKKIYDIIKKISFFLLMHYSASFYGTY